MLELLSYSFVQMGVLCVLVLAGIHAYLGHHVVSRGVIFVDLSLAQVAALGSIAAMWLGLEHGAGQYVISLLFTFAGALLISVARTKDERVPQEAFIGIIYAGSTAVSVLLLAHQPEGGETIQHMLAGSLLTVSPAELARVAVLYAVLGVFFYVLRGRFELISADRAAASGRGWNLVWWDFLFYAAFAVVVTTAVRIAGVLLVFSLLVIPPVAALLLTRHGRARLALGWVFAAAGAVGGVLASVGLDLPAGPSVMTALVILLLAAAAVRTLRAAGP